jgi:hypothetical protein
MSNVFTSTTSAMKTTTWFVIGAAVIVVALGAVWFTRGAAPLPSPNDDVAKLAKFMESDRFKNLSEAEQRPYMKRMRKSAAELLHAAQTKQINENEYETATLYGYLERQLDNMEDFYSVPEAARPQRLLAEYRQKAAESAAKKATTRPAAPLVVDGSKIDIDDDEKDEFIDDQLAKWPPERQQQWETYRAAVKAAKSAAGQK